MAKCVLVRHHCFLSAVAFLLFREGVMIHDSQVLPVDSESCASSSAWNNSNADHLFFEFIIHRDTFWLCLLFL